MNHRDDFTTNDLPEGYRALEMNEQRQPGDEYHRSFTDATSGSFVDAWFMVQSRDEALHVHSASFKHRTRRPFPVVAKCPACGQPLPH